MGNVVKLAAVRTAKATSERDRKFERADANQELLTLNEFNFESPDDDTLIIHEPGRAWLHKVAATFGLPRFPTNEAELLGTQQMLLFLVYAAKPALHFPKQDADWLAAGKGVTEDTAPWALNWFEAYLENDIDAMRQAMIDDQFIENAADDWRATEAERAALTGGSATEGPASTVVSLGQHRDQLRKEQLEAALYSDYPEYLPPPIQRAETVEHLAWWRANIAPLRDWKAKKARASAPDWQQDPVLAPLLDKRRKGSTLRKQLALLAETGDHKQVEQWLNMAVIWLNVVAKDRSRGSITIAVDSPYVLRTFDKAGYSNQFVQRMSHYSNHIIVGSEPSEPGPASRTLISLPVALG